MIKEFKITTLSSICFILETMRSDKQRLSAIQSRERISLPKLMSTTSCLHGQQQEEALMKASDVNNFDIH
jgi:hypothetical protein